MTATTVNDLVNGSLSLIGQLAEGETPSAATSQLGLRCLRDMVESMNNDSLMIYVILDNSVALPAGTQTMNVGVGQTLNIDWPTVVYDAVFVRDNNVSPPLDFPLTLLDEMQFASIAAKTIQSSYPRYVYAERNYPVMVLKFWPVPQLTLQLHVPTYKQLTDIASLTTSINLPPGYNRMLKYNLAIELANEFGVEPLPSTVKVAAKSKRSLMRVNDKEEVMNMPTGLMAGYWGANIYLGDTTR